MPGRSSPCLAYLLDLISQPRVDPSRGGAREGAQGGPVAGSGPFSGGGRRAGRGPGRTGGGAEADPSRGGGGAGRGPGRAGAVGGWGADPSRGVPGQWGVGQRTPSGGRTEGPRAGRRGRGPFPGLLSCLSQALNPTQNVRRVCRPFQLTIETPNYPKSPITLSP